MGAAVGRSSLPPNYNVRIISMGACELWSIILTPEIVVTRSYTNICLISRLAISSHDNTFMVPYTRAPKEGFSPVHRFPTIAICTFTENASSNNGADDLHDEEKVQVRKPRTIDYCAPAHVLVFRRSSRSVAVEPLVSYMH